MSVKLPFTPIMDKAIIARWPALPTFSGISRDRVRARAKSLGLVREDKAVYTAEIDQAIKDAWPELAVFEDIPPRKVKSRAYMLGLRLGKAEATRRKRKKRLANLKVRTYKERQPPPKHIHKPAYVEKWASFMSYTYGDRSGTK